jgi:serine protease AprX
MSKILFLICFLVLAVSQSVAQQKETYLVIFKDKANSPFELNDAASFLSEKSLDRRKKQHIVISTSDLPVNSTYITQLNNLGITAKNPSKWLNSVTINLPENFDLTRITALPCVKEILLLATDQTLPSVPTKFELPTLNKPQSTEKSIEKTTYNYGPSYWQSNQIGVDCMHQKGFIGQGLTIAVLDAGFFNLDTIHAFDSMRVHNQILGTRDFVSGGTSVYEDDAHGMYVMSTMAGNLPGELVGTAPKADYWLIRTENANTETLQEEYNWVLGAEFADSVGADIINSSLGYVKFDGGIGDHVYADFDGNTTIITKAADLAASKGIFVTISAGNSAGPPIFKIGAPADADSVLTVGAVDINGIIANFSSRGNTFDDRIKPNTCAKGVFAVVADDSAGIIWVNGTSFSSPITAGAVACLWQANPLASNMDLIFAIQWSASQYLLPDSIMGYGIPNFCTADSLLKGLVGISTENKDLTFACHVSPNPFSETVSLNLLSTTNETISIEIIDLFGSALALGEYQISANAKNHILLAPPRSLSAGIYSLVIRTKNSAFTTRILKQ